MESQLNLKVFSEAEEDLLTNFPQPWCHFIALVSVKNGPHCSQVERWLNEYHGNTGLDWNSLINALSESYCCKDDVNSNVLRLPKLLLLPVHVQRSVLYYLHRHRYALSSEATIKLIDSLNKHSIVDSWCKLLVRMLQYDSVDPANHRGACKQNDLTDITSYLGEFCVSDFVLRSSSQFVSDLNTVGGMTVINFRNSKENKETAIKKVSGDNSFANSNVAGVINSIDSVKDIQLNNISLESASKVSKRKTDFEDTNVDGYEKRSKIAKAEIESLSGSNGSHSCSIEISKRCKILKELFDLDDTVLTTRAYEPEGRNVLEAFILSSSEETERICQEISLDKFDFDKIVTICHLYCNDNIEACYDSCAIFIHQCLYPWISTLDSSAPRSLLACSECCLNRYPEAFVNTICMQLMKITLNPAQIEYVKTLIETIFKSSNCSYFLNQMIQDQSEFKINASKIKWDESKFSIILCIIQTRAELTSDQLMALLSLLYQYAVDMASSTIFITLLVNIINIYKAQIVPYIDFLDQILQHNKTPLKKSALTKLRRLQTT